MSELTLSQELKVILTAVICEALLLGVQSVVTIVGLYTVWSRDLRKSFVNRLLVGIIILLFCMSACTLSLTIWAYMAALEELSGSFDPTAIFNKVLTVTMIFQRLAYFISDSLVVWRAWILWDRSIFVRMLLIVCLLGTITATFAQGGLAINHQVRQTGGFTPELGVKTLMFTLPLLLTNLCATILIGIRIWQYRRNIMRHLSRSGSRKTYLHTVLVIFLESSALYSVFWILAVLAAIGNVISLEATTAIIISLPYVTSIYPIIVIIMVAIQRNGEYEFSTISMPASHTDSSSCVVPDTPYRHSFELNSSHQII
ncbi:hypothetical protein BDP27DRAFT_1450438 [Rhodocollybia butyracea]|uniref:Uncharacterized protein n=1 Tax=Rhodocollybia butyracea TaxID=206335 RepID=A0A9P5PN99_9AGAR|nr:hypothetical protein BDP27DRAFT_1450438 [Rhodocollybia butyracea]